MEGSVPHASACKRCADPAGRVPLGQIRDHSRRRTSSQSNRRFFGRRLDAQAALPVSSARCSPSVRMAGDLTAHHRRATSNQMSDTHLGQTRLQPRHDRRAILDTKHPTQPMASLQTHHRKTRPGHPLCTATPPGTFLYILQMQNT